MNSRENSLPPSAQRLALLTMLAFIAFALLRAGIHGWIPVVDMASAAQHDFMLVAPHLALAVFLYWLGRLRYDHATLWNKPGRLGLTVALAVGVTAACGYSWSNLVMTPMSPANDLARVAALAVGLATAVSEEIGFRGTLFAALREWKNDTWAVLVSAGLFGLMHVGERICAASPRIVLGGLAMSLARLRGVSLLGLIVIHVVVEAAWALYLPESGALDTTREWISAGLNALVCVILWRMRPVEPALA